MLKAQLKTMVSVAIISSAVSACGGGSNSVAVAPPAPDLRTAEGLWNGTTGSGRKFSGLVLDDGSYWFLYTSIGNNAVLGGAVEGSGTSSGGKFSSSDGLDFNLEGLAINPFALAGTYTAKSELGGTFTYSSGSPNTFTSKYDADYDLTPSLATIAGTYSGMAATADGSPDSVMVTIADSGAITGRSVGGCTFFGTATTRATGNVYNVALTFNGGSCGNGTSTVTGVAYYIASQNALVSTGLNSARTNGFIFEGAKP